MPLDEDVTRLAKGKNLATVVTLMPSGQPQAQLTWIDADDEHVLDVRVDGHRDVGDHLVVDELVLLGDHELAVEDEDSPVLVGFEDVDALDFALVAGELALALDRELDRLRVLVRVPKFHVLKTS